MPGDNHYKNPKHIKWRASVLLHAGYKCVECSKYGRTTEATHAHHIKPRLVYPELQYSVKNGMALCARCHNKIEPRVSPPPSNP